jgi:hypothetical protein
MANEEALGNRLALNKMDWDTLSAVDLLALFGGLCSGDKVVHRVEIYPSLFGLERMKHDAIYGPPADIFDPGAEAASKRRKHKKRNDSSDSEEVDLGYEDESQDENAYNQTRLRKYEIEKMKYYYAVVYCNSPKTALHLYDEYNGFEFENTTMRLNLSLIPDDIKFTQEIKDQAREVPTGYEFDFNSQKKINRALGHSKVKLTWDQNDAKREAKLAKGFTGEIDGSDAEREHYQGLMASSDDGDDAGKAGGNKMGEGDIEDYRRKLLDGLTGDKSHNFDKKGKIDAEDEVDLDNIDFDAINSDELNSEDIDRLEKGGKIATKKKNKDSREGLSIKFTSGFGEDVGKKLLTNKREKKELAKMSEYEKYQLKRKERKDEKRKRAQLAKENRNKQRNMTEEEIREAEKKREAYKLLIGDAVDESDMEFAGNAEDPRFAEVLR